MKVCKLSFALLFSFYLYGVHGRSGFYEGEIQSDGSDVEASSVENDEQLPVNDPGVAGLGTFAVNQLNHEKQEHDDPLLLLEIVQASSQVISVNLTLLTLKVSQGNRKEMCEVKILEEPWSQKIALVHSKCGTVPGKYEPYEVNTDDKNERGSCVGNNAVEELDVDNPEVVRLSTIAVDELNKEIVEGNDANNLLEIAKASVQAVSGKTANLMLTLKVSQGNGVKKCEVTIQQEIWLNETKVIKSNCENDTDETVSEASNKSHVFNDGHTEASVNNNPPPKKSNEKAREAVNDDNDEVNLDVNDPEVISLSAIALIELNVEKKEEDPPLTLTKIVKAVLHKHSKTVTLTLEISQGDTGNKCEFNLWEDSAEDKLDMTHSKCGTVPAKSQTENKSRAEGEEFDVDEAEVVRLSKMAMTELNDGNGKGDDPIVLLEIVKVTKHVDVEENSSSLTLKVSQGRDKKMCDVKIIEKQTSRRVKFTCETIKNDEIHPADDKVTDDPGLRVSDETQNNNYDEESDSYTFTDDESEVVDSLEEQEEEEEELDVNDPEVVRLTALAMVTLNNEKLEEDEPLTLMEIIKAASHLPSENSTSLTFKVSQGGNKYVCDMEFLAHSDGAPVEIRHSECGTVPAKSKTEGGDTAPTLSKVEKLEVNDPKVIRLSMIALVELYERYPGDGPMNLLEIVKASRQLVSGMLTSLTLKVSQGYYQMMCDVQILEQPWLKVTEITRAECEDIDENLMEMHGVNGLTRIIPLSKSVSSW